LVQQYQTSDVKDTLSTATFLDPQYKELPFLSTTEKEEILDEVESELISMHMVTEPDDVQTNELDELDPVVDQQKGQKRVITQKLDFPNYLEKSLTMIVMIYLQG